VPAPRLGDGTKFTKFTDWTYRRKIKSAKGESTATKSETPEQKDKKLSEKTNLRPRSSLAEQQKGHTKPRRLRDPETTATQSENATFPTSGKI